MEFDQLIEYNKRNIFLEKSCTRCGGENVLKKHISFIIFYYLTKFNCMVVYTLSTML